MEKLDVFDCSNVFIASYFTNDRDCAHCNREHTLIYILTGFFTRVLRESASQGHSDGCTSRKDKSDGAAGRPPGHPQFVRVGIRSLFESVIPYFDARTEPAKEILKLKMTEGMYAILHTDPNLYASLFDFTDP